MIRRAATVLGIVIMAIVALLNVPGNPVLELHRYRAPGGVASHAGVLLLVWGTAPRLRAAVLALATLPAGAQALRLSMTLVVLLLAMLGILLSAPTFGYHLLGREWGIVEPLQFATYLIAAWLCAQIASLTARGDPATNLYRAGRWVAIWLALEEVEYLGLPYVIAAALGSPRGRIGGHYIGTLHELVPLLADVVGWAPIAGVLVISGATGSWWFAARYRRGLKREVVSWTSLPLLGSALFMGIAQIIDSDDAIAAAIKVSGSPILKFLEEPLELLALICLLGTLVLKFSARCRVSDRAGAGSARHSAPRPAPLHGGPPSTSSSTIIVRCVAWDFATRSRSVS